MKMAPTVDADSTLCACECQELVGAGDIDSLAIESEDPIEERSCAGRDHGRGTDTTETARTERHPDTDSERDYQQAREVGSELVVEPRAARRQRAEIRDVVARRAERLRLSQVGGDPAGVERDEGEQPARASEPCSP